MTDTTEASPSPGLMPDFIVSLLTPFLMTGSVTDPALARRAATETIAAYKTTRPDCLITVIQIITFALASVDSLRLSLTPGLSPSMQLKLRGNANALNRSCQLATRAFDTPRHDSPATEAPAPRKAAKIPVQEPTRPDPAETDRQIDLSWAGAMTDVAKEFNADLGSLPPIQRRLHLARIGALSEIARTLGRGDAPPLKARLLGSTALRG